MTDSRPILSVVPEPVDLQEAIDERRQKINAEAYNDLHDTAISITRLLYRSEREVPKVEQELLGLVRRMSKRYRFLVSETKSTTTEQEQTNDEGEEDGNDN